DRPSFAFPPAFMKEVSLHVAAEWTPEDMQAVLTLRKSDALCLKNLITHHTEASNASMAYRTAFEDPTCLKMALSWRDRDDHAH
ncbi:MAG: chlorophyll synthesis pathway protein BchC, partial [Pseudomonadota bacterium]